MVSNKFKYLGNLLIIISFFSVVLSFSDVNLKHLTGYCFDMPDKEICIEPNILQFSLELIGATLLAASLFLLFFYTGKYFTNINQKKLSESLKITSKLIRKIFASISFSLGGLTIILILFQAMNSVTTITFEFIIMILLILVIPIFLILTLLGIYFIKNTEILFIDLSLILTYFSIISFFVSTGTLITYCLIKPCDGLEGLILIPSWSLSAFLFGIAIILLLINKFKKND